MNKWNQAQGRLAETARLMRMYIEQKFKGSATPEATATLQQDLDGVFKDLDQLRQRRDELSRAEAKLKFSLEQIPSNVIPIQRALADNKTSEYSKKWMLRLDCLIESPHVSEIHKMALELHSQSYRYAFVEYRDLDKSMRSQLTELLKLGAISLFVADILSLTNSEQKVLRSLIELDTVQRPLLMAGTTIPYADLRVEGTVDSDFLALLSRAYFKLTRPFREYKDQGLINYFLDSLS